METAVQSHQLYGAAYPDTFRDKFIDKQGDELSSAHSNDTDGGRHHLVLYVSGNLSQAKIRRLHNRAIDSLRSCVNDWRLRILQDILAVHRVDECVPFHHQYSFCICHHRCFGFPTQHIIGMGYTIVFEEKIHVV